MNTHVKEWIETSRNAIFQIVMIVFLSGCKDFPKDPEGTFDRIVQSGELRIGVIEEYPWAFRREDGTPAGLEVELAEGFAGSLSTRPQWHWVSEAEAVEKLENLEFDLVIGGITEDSPRRRTLGFSRPYLTTYSARRDKNMKRVFAVPMGENRLMTELEKYLP